MAIAAVQRRVALIQTGRAGRSPVRRIVWEQAVPKPEWGVKRICHACGTKYYDFNNSPVVCPNCGTEFDPEAFLKSRRSRSTADTAKAAAPAVVAAVAPDLEEDTPEEAEDEALEADELDDADTDAAEDTGTPIASDDDDDAEEEGEFASDEDESDDALLEDASELGDDDMDDVIEVEDGEDEDR